ncbi:Forkhead box protein J2 [Glugoides intestinalis]
MKFDGEDCSQQRPNIENPLTGKQYPTTFLSYLDFCKVLADKEEMKEYVFLNFDEIAIRRIEERLLADEKPTDSYALMIYKALEGGIDGRLTLAEIYSWIETNYPYYKTADPVWKNSIRHNLSLNPTFKKIPRPANSKGKGGYWAIDQTQRQGKLLKNRKQNTGNVQVSNEILNLKTGRMIF